MENLHQIVKLQKKRMGVYDEVEKVEKKSDLQIAREILEVLVQDMEFVKEQQRYTLSEQEKNAIKMQTIEETMSMMVDNQKDMSNKIDTLIERWGK